MIKVKSFSLSISDGILAPAMSNPAALGGSWRRIGSGEDSDTLKDRNEGVNEEVNEDVKEDVNEDVNEEVNEDVNEEVNEEVDED